MSVAFIYLATRVPSMLGNASPFDSWLQTLYFGFSLPRPMARSISSGNRIHNTVGPLDRRSLSFILPIPLSPEDKRLLSPL